MCELQSNCQLWVGESIVRISRVKEHQYFERPAIWKCTKRFTLSCRGTWQIKSTLMYLWCWEACTSGETSPQEAEFSAWTCRWRWLLQWEVPPTPQRYLWAYICPRRISWWSGAYRVLVPNRHDQWRHCVWNSIGFLSLPQQRRLHMSFLY